MSLRFECFEIRIDNFLEKESELREGSGSANDRTDRSAS